MEHRKSTTRRTALGALTVVACAATALVAVATNGQAVASRTVPAVLETQLFPSGSGDIADDSAIWFDASNPANSVVVADSKAAKGGGIAVYDLAGTRLSYQSVGMIGNVDLREGFPLGGGQVVLVAANDRIDDTLRFWSLDPVTRALTPVSAPIPTLTPNYGLCLYKSPVTAKFYAFVDQRNGGRLEQYELADTAGSVTATLVRSFDIGSQTEGCVADDELGRLYVGEENVGIWRYGAEPGDGSARVAVDTVGAGRLVADVEGLALTYGPDGAGNLIVSSQGDSTIAVYERGGANAYVRSVAVGASGTVDAVTSTDGVAASAASFGGAFAGGLLVVHDNSNTGGSMSNLKYVRLADVLAADPPPPPPPAPGALTTVTTTLTAVADTYLSTTAHGGVTSLKVSASQYTTLLRFDTTTLPANATVGSAVLQPYSPSASATCRYEVHAAGDVWTESTVKASTGPPVSAAVLGTSAALLAKTRMPVTLPTSAVPVRSRFTLAVKGAPGCTLGYLASKETANGTRLVVTYTTA